MPNVYQGKAGPTEGRFAVVRVDQDAVRQLRRALEIDPHHFEARIYLGNLLYDRGEFEASLYHFEQS